MNPRDFLELAGELVTGLGEAEWRTAVSRAYYAAFHVARGLLRSGGFRPPPSEQAHAYLWLRLANSGHPDVATAAHDLRALRQARNQADYDLDRPFSPATALGQVQVAESVIQLLELVESEPAIRGQIIDAMKAYERDVLGEVTWHP